MSCRRIRRELIERFRFGELDGRSAPHLEHLRGCVECRDDVGLDRVVVRNLQRALENFFYRETRLRPVVLPRFIEV